MNQFVLTRFLIAISIVAGLFVSWEPGPEVKRHSHPHDASHEASPPHGSTETVTFATFFEDLLVEAKDGPPPSDLHYHVSFDHGSESGLVQKPANVYFASDAPDSIRGVDDRQPERVALETEKPPLI